MDSSNSRLSPLQEDLLVAFFARTQRFFLTGGAALAGFYLRHRDTKDLDLFAPSDTSIDEGVRALQEGAIAEGAVARVLQASGDFRRFAVARGDELTLVDLVIDRAPQVSSEKAAFGQIRVDPLREIAANKLCAILDRAEIRDLVDLKCILDGGMRLADMLADAQRKHAGADPATLAFVLSELRIAPTAPLPVGQDAAEIDAFRQSLSAEFARLALPDE